MNEYFVKHETKSLPARAEDFTFSSHRNSFSRIPVGFSIRLNDWLLQTVINEWQFCEPWHEIASCQSWGFHIFFSPDFIFPDSGGIILSDRMIDYSKLWWLNKILWNMTRNHFLTGLRFSDFLLTGVLFPGFRWDFLSDRMIDNSKLL